MAKTKNSAKFEKLTKHKVMIINIAGSEFEAQLIAPSPVKSLAETLGTLTFGHCRDMNDC